MQIYSLQWKFQVQDFDFVFMGSSLVQFTCNQEQPHAKSWLSPKKKKKFKAGRHFNSYFTSGPNLPLCPVTSDGVRSFVVAREEHLQAKPS